MRRISISDSNWDLLMQYITEGRATPNLGDPTDLTALLADNKDVQFISLLRHDGSRVNFKLEKEAGFPRIKNITPKAMYLNFSGDFRPKSMIFGNKAYINYDHKIITYR
jgi:hypothetical protein